MEKRTNERRGGGGLERKKGMERGLMVRKRVKRGQGWVGEEGRLEGEGVKDEWRAGGSDEGMEGWAVDGRTEGWRGRD